MDNITLRASDGADVACYDWPVASPRGVVQIAHGMGEHARRYDQVAQELNAAGFAVRANDHRGHGETGKANLGYMGIDGWNRTLADAFEINRELAATYPNVPLILLGHSMGSMLSQQYITRYPASIDALVLSGSPGFKAPSINPIPRWILRFEKRRVGADGTSPVMQKLLFGGANKPFDAPDATGFEWLSRDAAQVQKYVDDAYCGFVISTGSLQDLYAGSAVTAAPGSLAAVPKDLPIYVFSGSEDPVHSEREDIKRMVAAFTEIGLKNVTLRWYEGGRHEMFNEINRDEVVQDLVSWLNDHAVVHATS